MRKVILGSGLLASELNKITGWETISRKENNIDALHFENWKHLLDSYDIVINCIANTNTYSINKEEHWNINYKFVSELVDYCNQFNKKIVHISTDYVYTNSVENASENDIPVHGNNWYSYTKLLADAYIELKSKNYLICRGTHKPKPFPYERAWKDQVGNFDYVDVIASLIINLINKEATGLYNIGTNKKSMLELACITNKKVISDLKPIDVPSNTSMNVNKLKNIGKKNNKIIMDHYYQDIGEDWFTYPGLYKRMVKTFNSGLFVEIGSWKGRSASFMGVEILNSGKNIQLHCVDTWAGSSEHIDVNSDKFEINLYNDKDYLYKEFLKNIKPIEKIVKPIRNDSLEASKMYSNNSIDFIFIDASHSFLDVYNDINHWIIKLKKGGYIACHDYDWCDDVKKAVHHFFDLSQIEITEGCWVYKKN